MAVAVSWWWAGLDGRVAGRRLREIGTSIEWVAGCVVRGDTKALLASWQHQRKQARWRRINEAAKIGMQSNIEGNYSHAEAMLRRELELATDLPQWSRTILWMRESLGTALIAQRKYSEAQMTYQRASDDIPPAAHTPRRQNLIALLYSLESVQDKAALPLALWGLERSAETFGQDEPTTNGFEAKVEQLKDGK